MNKLAFLSLLAAAATPWAHAQQEQARVLSVTPIVQQVAVPQQVCGNETVYTGPRTSGGGAVLGAIAGGAAGNAIGGGTGRAAATAIGLIGGALLGNQIEGNGRPAYQDVQRCSTQTFYENRAVGYTVVYEYAGRQYTTQTATPPGTHIPVQVTPVGGNTPYGSPYPPQPAMGAPVGVVTAPPVAYAAQPVSPAYPAYPAYRPMVVQPAYAYPVAPVGVSLGINLSSGMRHDLYR